MSAIVRTKGNPGARVVGVIASAKELAMARRMRQPPDLFELRLDYLDKLQKENLAHLPRPIILTARRAREGGRRNFPAAQRRDLLLQFLPQATWVDVELRSLASLCLVWEEARRTGVGRICSLHDLFHTPTLSVLRGHLETAMAAGADVFKIVTRAERIEDFLRLLEFLASNKESQRLAVLATGKYGPLSRQLFPALGSCLVYAPLGRTFHRGQLTLRQWRKSHAKKISAGAKPL